MAIFDVMELLSRFADVAGAFSDFRSKRKGNRASQHAEEADARSVKTDASVLGADRSVGASDPTAVGSQRGATDEGAWNRGLFAMDECSVGQQAIPNVEKLKVAVAM